MRKEKREGRDKRGGREEGERREKREWREKNKRGRRRVKARGAENVCSEKDERRKEGCGDGKKCSVYLSTRDNQVHVAYL